MLLLATIPMHVPLFILAYMARPCKENLHIGRLIEKYRAMSGGEKGPSTSKQFYFTTIEMKYHQSSVTK